MITNESLRKVMDINMEKKYRIAGCMYGGAVGDALGYPIEFQRRIPDGHYRTYPRDRGIVSDDTQMTLFTANAILWRETQLQFMNNDIPLQEALHQAYLDWYDTQLGAPFRKAPIKGVKHPISWIKDDPTLRVMQAPGNTCLSALMSGNIGSYENPLNNSKGCGGVMRVAPIGIASRCITDACAAGGDASAITHGHPMGIIPAAMLSCIIYCIVGENTDLRKAIDMSKLAVAIQYGTSEVKPLCDMIDDAIELSKCNITDVDSIRKIGEGWVADEALAIAIYSCLKHEKNFTDAIVCAVNHDGDSDSTGAIAGNIMGAMLGHYAIPDYYLANLDVLHVITEITEDLITLVIEGVPMNHDGWKDKYF